MIPFIKRAQIANMNIHYKQYSLEYFLDAQQKIGLTSVSLWWGPPHFWLDYMSYSDCKAINCMLRKRNLKCVGFCATASQYRNQYCIYEPEHRERSFRYFANGIKAAAELGCHSFHVNSGWGYKTEQREDAWERAKDMLIRLSNVAQQEGTVLTMECLRPDETELVVTKNDAKCMFDEIHHPAFKIMVDTNPMAVANETIWQWFDTFGGSIQNLHFVDCNPYGHLIWGDGTLPLENILMCLNHNNYTGYLSLEVTDPRYMSDPMLADIQNTKTLFRYVND